MSSSQDSSQSVSFRQNPTSSKRRRRFRRPGPPDRLSWLGGSNRNEVNLAGSEQSGTNDSDGADNSEWTVNRFTTEISNKDTHLARSSAEDWKRTPQEISPDSAIDLTREDDDFLMNDEHDAGDKYRSSKYESSFGIVKNDETTKKDKPFKKVMARKPNYDRKSKGYQRKKFDNPSEMGNNDDEGFGNDGEKVNRGDHDKRDKERWQCRFCTLINSFHETRCAACEKRRQSTRSTLSHSGKSNIFSRKKRITSFIKSSDSESDNNDSDIRVEKNTEEPNSRGKTIKRAGENYPWRSANRSPRVRRENSVSSSKKLATPTGIGGDRTFLSSELWTDKYFPQNSRQLCLAPKKVEEIRQWLSSYTSSWQSKRQSDCKLSAAHHGGGDSTSDAKMMILVGSPGIGKSTAINVLAQEMKLEILTWNDSHVDYNKNYHYYFDENWRRGTSLPYQSQLSSFEEFLSSGGAGMKSLDVAPLSMDDDIEETVLYFRKSTRERRTTLEHEGSLILIEEIPNLYNANAAQKFRNIMEQHIHRTVIPTVLVFSDVYEGKHKPEELERLIPSQVLYSSMVQILSIQPVTKSKMKSCMESIAKAEGLGRLPLGFGEELYLASSGDLRHSILEMQFRLNHTAASHKSSREKFRGKPGNLSKRDVKLSTFHALGKLLYAKRRSPGQDAISTSLRGSIWGDGRGPLEFIPEEVLDHTDISKSSALSFLEYHGPDFFTDITDLSKAFDRFSDAATFLDKFSTLHQNDSPFPMEYGSSIASRAIADANKTPTPHRFRHFSAPKVFDVIKKKNENETKMEQLRKRLSYCEEISMNDIIGSAHQFVIDSLPYMRTILRRDVDYALANLHSYVKDAYGDQMSSAVLPEKHIRQNDILLDDDIVDDDSWDGHMNNSSSSK